MMDLLREAAPKSNQVTDTFGIVPQHVINLQAGRPPKTEVLCSKAHPKSESLERWKVL